MATQVFDTTEIRQWLRQAVKYSGLSPGGLAKKAGVSSTTVTRVYYGRARHAPTWRTLSRISDAAGLALSPGGSAFTAFAVAAEKPTADTPQPSVEGAAPRPREVPAHPQAGLFASLMDLLGSVHDVQDGLIATRATYPEAASELELLNQDVTKLRDHIYALARKEGVRVPDLVRAVLRKDAKEAFFPNEEAAPVLNAVPPTLAATESEVDQPQPRGRKTAA
jgi:hypothetical protein